MLKLKAFRKPQIKKLKLYRDKDYKTDEVMEEFDLDDDEMINMDEFVRGFTRWIDETKDAMGKRYNSIRSLKDDMLIAAKKKYDIQKLKGLLSAEFEMKDLGAAWKILGMEIIRDRERRKLFLSQRSYIQKVLARFGMSSSKPIDTPSAANIHLTAMFAPQSEEEKEYMSRVPYVSAVGSLMYAMVCTRPDLAHAVSVVSRFMGQPGREHWQAVKRIFRYLRGTSDVGLIYGGDTQCLVTGYSDSDYAGDVDTRRSMTGYVFTLGGSVVSWKATLQPTVTLSTTEAEYMALTEAAKEGIWLKGLNSTEKRSLESNENLSSVILISQCFSSTNKYIKLSTNYGRTITQSNALYQVKELKPHGHTSNTSLMHQDITKIWHGLTSIASVLNQHFLQLQYESHFHVFLLDLSVPSQMGRIRGWVVELIYLVLKPGHCGAESVKEHRFTSPKCGNAAAGGANLRKSPLRALLSLSEIDGSDSDKALDFDTTSL
uniref:Reverse transcriptase Ty1/copia-type domain-containing protein n=1 Tax=Solanum lycopersicum TaxID=4081 RepID=A0A3Q7IAK2_SOLLC